MDRNGIDWEGPFTAMITPFHADGAIDERGLRDHVEFLIGNGVRGIVPNGCTGEFWAQSLPERKRVVEIVQDAAGRRVPVLAGVGAAATRDVVELTEHAHAIGCAGVAGVVDLRGTADALGREMQVTEVAIVDELAAAAELVMGKSTNIPVAVIRGVDASWLRDGSVADEIVRSPKEDLFR